MNNKINIQKMSISDSDENKYEFITNDKHYSSSDDEDIKNNNDIITLGIFNEEISESNYQKINVDMITENILIKILYNLNIKRLINDFETQEKKFLSVPNDWFKIMCCTKYINEKYMNIWCDWLEEKNKNNNDYDYNESSWNKFDLFSIKNNDISVKILLDMLKEDNKDKFNEVIIDINNNIKATNEIQTHFTELNLNKNFKINKIVHDNNFSSITLDNSKCPHINKKKT